MTKKILILDDHPLIIEGLKQLLESYDAYRVVKSVNNWHDLFRALESSIDLLILDLNIKSENSLNRLPEIKSIQPNLKILVFSSYNTPSLVRKAFESKVEGYLLKDTVQEELFEALEIIFAGKVYIGPRVALPKRGLLRGYKTKDFQDKFTKLSSLSKREMEVVNLIVEGFDNQSIADQLFISKHTVQSHRKKIFKKLEVHSATELVKLVMR